MSSFLHISDLHISCGLRDTQNENNNPNSNLEMAINITNKLTPKPKFVIFSGDLTDKGDLESYEYLKSVISASKIPIILALGNHDNRSNFRKVFYGSEIGDPYFHASEYDEFKVIVLDTSKPSKVSGTICENQFIFLQEVLNESKNHKVLLVLHHPPSIDEDDLPWTTLDKKSSKELYNCLKDHDISGIFCGHIHLNKFINWNNIPIITSSGLQSTIDPLEKKELRLLEAASVNLCKLNKGGLNITSLQIHPAGRELRRVDKKLLGLMV